MRLYTSISCRLEIHCFYNLIKHSVHSFNILNHTIMYIYSDLKLTEDFQDGLMILTDVH